MIRRPCYIAAPYGDPNPVVRGWNVGRACALARLAVAEDRAPVLVHPGISMIYGPTETPELRDLGLQVDAALVELVAHHPLGELWILEGEGGALSPGVALELATWTAARGPRDVRRGTWEAFRPSAVARGLAPRWVALEAPPDLSELGFWARALGERR